MVQRACRLWNLSAACLIVLTAYNILLTLKFMYTPDCSKNIIHVQNPPEPPRNPCVSNIDVFEKGDFSVKLDLRLGRLDNSLKYKYFDNFWVGESFPDLNDRYTVCLATQSSLERLHSLVEVANHWSGPISVSVFAAGDDELNLLLLYITYLRQCQSNVRNRVSFHLAIPKSRVPRSVDIDVEQISTMDCNRPEVTLKQMLKHVSSETTRWKNKNAYPQNHMRNLARKNCQTRFVYLTDVDIIPSYRQADELERFLRRTDCKTKCAYVIPTYELDERVVFPSNKSDLLRLANKGLARPFHQKVFIFNQFATNFSKWQNTISQGSDIHISHTVTNFEFLYEPFYVAADDAPPHDERFVGYGYTRNTQVYEMFVAGYDFFVLSPIFTCHWGLSTKRSKPAWREQQNNENRKKFDNFKHEVFAKYGRDPLNMMKRKIS
ncbi:hypothetical protein Trydic_g5241 [Trypoxylus dichotomus]